MNVQQILCPIDFSGTSKKALEVASELARDNSALLHIVHVIQDQSPELTPDQAQSELDATSSFFLTTPAGTNVTFQQHLLSGEPEEVIVDFIANNEIDVVVVGSRGRGKSVEPVGSFAASIVLKSPVPVLVVREDMQVRAMTRPASFGITSQNAVSK